MFHFDAHDPNAIRVWTHESELASMANPATFTKSDFAALREICSREIFIRLGVRFVNHTDYDEQIVNR